MRPCGLLSCELGSSSLSLQGELVERTGRGHLGHLGAPGGIWGDLVASGGICWHLRAIWGGHPWASVGIWCLFAGESAQNCLGVTRYWRFVEWRHSVFLDTFKILKGEHGSGVAGEWRYAVFLHTSQSLQGECAKERVGVHGWRGGGFLELYCAMAPYCTHTHKLHQVN